MTVATHIRQLFNRGGATAVLKGAFRFVYWQSGLRSTRYALEYKRNCKHAHPLLQR